MTARFRHGEPSWVDLMTTEPAAAAEFYNAVFGWEATEPTPEAGGYQMLRTAGQQVAGLGPQPDEQKEYGIPPTWNAYIDVADVDATVATAERAGGKVAMPPMDVMTAGRMAFIIDPVGAVLGCWQAADHKGAELVHAPGSLGWIELLTPDTESATRFYADVFGWTPKTAEGYTEFQLEGDSVAGMMARPEELAAVPPFWAVYFVVSDVDHTTAVALDNGADVVVPPTDVMEGRIRFSQLHDPQGALFGLLRGGTD